MASSRTYDLPIPEDTKPEDGLALAREKGAEYGITFEGDAETGRFHGTAEGSYRVADGRLHLEIRKKPFYVPWSMIESQMKKVFGTI